MGTSNWCRCNNTVCRVRCQELLSVMLQTAVVKWLAVSLRLRSCMPVVATGVSVSMFSAASVQRTRVTMTVVAVAVGVVTVSIMTAALGNRILLSASLLTNCLLGLFLRIARVRRPRRRQPPCDANVRSVERVRALR